MKKITLIKVSLILTLMLTAFPSFSQTPGAGSLFYGGRVGLTSSGFTHHGDVFSLKKEGFTLGGFGDYRLDNMFGVTAELNYLQQGAFHINPAYIYVPSEITIGTI